MGADRGCVLLADPDTREIVPQVFSHVHRGGDEDRMPVSRSIVDYVLARRQGVRTADARSDTRFEPGQSILQAGIREAMCVPMQGRYALMGVIYVDITTPPERVILDANLGGHEAVVADVDGDGDLDICSKDWTPRKENALGGKNHFDYLENITPRRSK